MSDGNHGVKVFSKSGQRAYCVTCKDELEDEDIAFLVRLKRGDAFDSLCSACAHELVKAARLGMENDKFLFYFL